MTDNKLTDSEIIKALECCTSTTTNEACVGCPFNNQKLCDKDQWILERYALDLINRLQAENENYSKNNQTMTSDILKLYKELELAKAENERLNKEISDREVSHINLYNETKAEIERLNTLIAETNEQRGAIIHAITHIDEVKAEAYKEFAEIYAEKFILLFYLDYHQAEVARELCKRTLKELVGEDK